MIVNENLFEKDFQDLDIKYEQHSPEEQKVPINKRLRPFFFMRKIEKTITEGGFLTESLFVPKYVWNQKETKLQGLERKNQCFDDLKKEFQKVGIIYSKKSISNSKQVCHYTLH